MYFYFVKGQWEDSSSYIGPSISFFSDILKVFHILYVLQLLLYNYLLEIENKLQFNSVQYVCMGTINNNLSVY